MLKGLISASLCVVSSLAGAQTSAQFRASHTLGVDAAFAVVSLPFPASKGVALNVNLSGRWQLGLSYMNSGFEVNFSKLNLAGFKERHAGLIARRFFGNSFNLNGGYVYRSNEIYLDPNVYGFSVSDHSVRTEARSDMLQFGISNHWQLEHWTLAVDWLTLTLPVNGEVTQSAADQAAKEQRDDVRRAEDVLTWYPNLAVGTVRLGYMF